MLNRKMLSRSMVLAAIVAMLLGSSTFAQDRNRSRTNDERGYANRVVEGTVASVARDRRGERVRLTNGMDLVVPNSITGMERGRRYGAGTLEPGDVVRMNVYSREGDGRDAVVRSLEILERNGVYQNDRRLRATVVSVDRRSRTMVVRMNNGRVVDVDLRNVSERSRDRYREGDRVSISGRMRRGTIVAEDIRTNDGPRN